MIPEQTLRVNIREYRHECDILHHRPTYTGLGRRLGVSRQTISNVVHGYYDGLHRYSDKPRGSRAIDNKYFGMVRALYDRKK